MLALRKARIAASPPILRGGFRPFFLGGVGWAIISLVFWLCAFLYGMPLPSAFDPLAWHRHEMLFGFVGAVVTGFLLTAIPNWTGRLPIAGTPLAILFTLWLAGRLALLWSSAVGLLVAAIFDVGFYIVFATVAGREVIAARNRNLPIVVMVLLLGMANAVDYAAAAGFSADFEVGSRAGVAIVVTMIAMVGGRIIPSFTRNWITKRGSSTNLPTQPSRYDHVVLVLTGLALLAWVAMPLAALTGAVLVMAGAFQMIRLARWRGWRTFSDPLVLILHIGYLWLPFGLVLLGWSALDPALPRTAAVHALTAGAMATMILAVMTRASLGHTGRELRASPLTVLAYALVTVGAILRVATPLHLIDNRAGLEAASLLWGTAFAVFLIAYAPVLLRARLGDPSG